MTQIDARLPIWDIGGGCFLESKEGMMTRERWRSLTVQGWVQDQHGAWPMAIIPIVMGSSIGGWLPIHGLLFISWFSGFHAFHAATLWAKARSSSTRRKRYIPALNTWLSLTLLSLALLIASIPLILWWTPLFAPLITVAAWESWRKNDRSLAARMSTIIASTLTLPLAAWVSEVSQQYLSASLPDSAWSAFVTALSFPQTSAAGYSVWTISFLIGAYFLASVPYVRSLIRGRNDHRWWIGSVSCHLIVAILVTGGGFLGYAPVSPLAIFLWWLLTTRSFLVPWLQRRGLFIRPKHIGIGEFFATVALLLSC